MSAFLQAVAFDSKGYIMENSAVIQEFISYLKYLNDDTKIGSGFFISTIFFGIVIMSGIIIAIFPRKKKSTISS